MWQKSTPTVSISPGLSRRQPKEACLNTRPATAGPPAYARHSRSGTQSHLCTHPRGLLDHHLPPTTNPSSERSLVRGACWSSHYPPAGCLPYHPLHYRCFLSFRELGKQQTLNSSTAYRRCLPFCLLFLYGVAHLPLLYVAQTQVATWPRGSLPPWPAPNAMAHPAENVCAKTKVLLL